MKFYHAVVVALACVGVWESVSLPDETSRNLNAAEVVRNDFERNYDGWFASANGVRLVATQGAGVDNSRGMVVTGRGAPREGASSSKGLYLKGGVSYDYSVQVYSETSETFRLRLFCRRFGPGQTTDVELAAQTVEAGKWTTLSGSYAAPEGSSGYLLTIANDSTNDFRFDSVSIVGEPSGYEAGASEQGLKDKFAPYFRVGNILNGRTINDPTIVATILKDFSSVECENETKPMSTMVRAQSGDDDVAVTLRSAAPIFDFCVNHHIAVRGHTLVWHSQTPLWFFKKDFKDDGEWVDAATMDVRMENYIKNLFDAIETQYPDLELYAFDVCNECVSDDFNRLARNDGARVPAGDNFDRNASPWVRIYGDNSFVEKAFTYARKYAPSGCALYYNDYNEYMGPKRDRIYEMCKSLFDKGLLDGVGMQAHLKANIDGFGGTDSCVAAMKKYLSIGCDVQFTEMDVSLDNGRFSLEDQANKYAGLFKAAIEWNAEHPEKNRVTAVCLWGPNDANSWLARNADALLYDRDNRPKPAYDALLSLEITPRDGDDREEAQNGE